MKKVRLSTKGSSAATGTESSFGTQGSEWIVDHTSVTFVATGGGVCYTNGNFPYAVIVPQQRGKPNLLLQSASIVAEWDLNPHPAVGKLHGLLV
jgi:hypothetical protein